MNLPPPKTSPATTTGSLHFATVPPGTATHAEAAMEHGEIDVPLDYGRPDQATLTIAVSRVKATGTADEYRGALLVNPGGPGTPGLNYAATKRAKMPELLRRSFDIIGFDPRGVGHSAGIDSGRIGGLFGNRCDPVPHDRAQERCYLEALSALAADCVHEIGDKLPHLNTVNTARDMDRIRHALGQPELHFLGISYGTYLGATYAALFPHHTGRMVLDSVVSPTSWHDFDLSQGFAMIAQRDVLFDWIAAHPAFGLGHDRATVRANYLWARHELAARPAHGDFGVADFDHVVYRTLSRTERWEPFARALSNQVITGDNGALRPEDHAFGPQRRNYETILRVVKCADSIPSSTGDVLDAVRALRAADPQPILTGLESHASPFWPQPLEPAPLGHPDMPPVLLTHSEHDPATPYEGAKRMQAALPGSRLVTLANCYSHGAFASQRNDCLDSTVADYLVHGVVPTYDVRCTGPGLPQATIA